MGHRIYSKKSLANGLSPADYGQYLSRLSFLAASRPIALCTCRGTRSATRVHERALHADNEYVTMHANRTGRQPLRPSTHVHARLSASPRREDDAAAPRTAAQLRPPGTPNAHRINEIRPVTAGQARPRPRHPLPRPSRPETAQVRMAMAMAIVCPLAHTSREDQTWADVASGGGPGG